MLRVTGEAEEFRYQPIRPSGPAGVQHRRRAWHGGDVGIVPRVRLQLVLQVRAGVTAVSARREHGQYVETEAKQDFPDLYGAHWVCEVVSTPVHPLLWEVRHAVIPEGLGRARCSHCGQQLSRLPVDLAEVCSTGFHGDEPTVISVPRQGRVLRQVEAEATKQLESVQAP